MKAIFINVFYLIFGFSLLLPACSNAGEETSETKSYPIADGTFIQDYLVAKWDDEQWQNELGFLKEAGMNYLILAPALHTDENGVNRIIYQGSLPGTTIKYPNDLIENCLRNAKKAGFKVFIGLNFNEKWWTANFTPDWLFDQMKLGNAVADELVRRYKDRYKETLYGWYWVWEVDNLNCTTPERQEILAQALNINIDHLNEITPEMPFMLCPFVNYRVGNSKSNKTMWQNVFSKTHFRKDDIFAPQDCVGAGGLELSMVDEWFRDMHEAVKMKPGLLFWSDAETFDQRFWTSAPIDRFIRQMEIVKPYVSKIITFAYSHYYSPLQTKKGFHETYLKYIKTGVLTPRIPPSSISNLSIYIDFEGVVNLNWKEPGNREPVAGYYIYRDNQLIANLQYKKEAQYINSFMDKSYAAGANHVYEICSYSFDGTSSDKISVTLK